MGSCCNVCTEILKQIQYKDEDMWYDCNETTVMATIGIVFPT